MKTHVCITVDTEFNIAGAFADQRKKPVGVAHVWCPVGGRPEGLSFLLDTFRRHKVRGSFFVETENRHYFGDAPMREVAQLIAGKGHEVQLHVHPCWSVFKHADWFARVQAEPRQDDFFGRDEESSAGLIGEGLDTIASWGLPRPTVFRSGSLQHDDKLYRALARCGVPYSSNVGIGIFDSGDPQYALYSGAHHRHGVKELPVLSFHDGSLGRPRRRCLTIAGTSAAEMRTLLERAHRAGLEQVVVLTHSFEYVQRADDQFRHSRRHHVNRARLERLCAFLRANQDRFSASGIGATAALPHHRSGDETNVQFTISRLHAMTRLAAQVGYEAFGNFALRARKPG